MGITRLAITRPLAILMFILGLVMLGIVSYRSMRVDRMPNISIPFVSVSDTYAGASPEDIEQFIVKPIEGAVSGISGVDTISSTSSQGRGSVNIQLAEGADANQAAIDVERAVSRIRSQLPADAGDPTVNKMDPNAFPILEIALSGNRSLADLYDLAANNIQPQLQSVLGVAQASVVGGLTREVQVQVDYTKLESYGLTLQQLISAIQSENLDTSAGSLDEGRRTISIRAVGLFQSVDDLKNLIVGTVPGSGAASGGVMGGSSGGPAAGVVTAGPVYLRDVADVVETTKPQTTILRLNGKESVGIMITAASDANSLQVSDGVKAAIAGIQRTLPPDVKMVVVNDSSRFTRSALDSVQTDLVMAMFLCGIVLLLFLHSWRNTLIVILAIPTSLISTFLVMYALGFTLDTISLMALALTVGILVDDSIVVLENINRHLHLGELPRIAALNGRNEIGLAAMAITLTDIVVYLPVAFMQQNIGKMFREYGLTIAAATLFSLFISFTLTPMLASRWLKEKEENDGRGLWARFTRGWESNYEKLADTYARVLAWALRRRPAIIAIGFVALAIGVSFLSLNLIGSEYAPQEDDNQFSVNVQMPPGTALAATNAAVVQLESMMKRIPEIKTMYTSVGGGGGFGGGGGASIDVELVDKTQRSRSIFQVISDVRRMASSIPEMNVQANVQSAIMGGGFNGLQVRIAGQDLPTLVALSNQITQALRQVPGIVDARNGADVGQPEVRAVLNRQRMAELGVSASSAGLALRTAINGTVASELQPDGQLQRDITVISKDANRRTTNDILQIPLLSVNGAAVTLGQIADLVPSTSPAQINRINRERVVSVSAVVVGRSIGDVARDARAQLANVPMPDGYSVTLAGGVQQLDQAFAALTSALALSVVLIYMLMVALYESWLYPLAIMFSLPVSLVGAFLGLLVTGNTLNIFSMIGMIMLMGLVAKNAILLVDYTNTLRARGLPRSEAIVEAGRTRLRPILMTTCTILFAMLPLAMKFEAGAESRSPMAVVVMGGVVSSTLLTLVLVPVMYTYLDDLQSALNLERWSFKRLFRKAPLPVVAGGSDEGD